MGKGNEEIRPFLAFLSFFVFFVTFVVKISFLKSGFSNDGSYH